MPQDNIRTSKISVANALLIPEILAIIGEGHTVTLPLRGYSMRPFLEDRRDKALLSAAETVAVGDVVLAEIAPKRYALHRIVGLDGNSVTLLGDGNLACEHCQRSDIKAKALGFYRKGRTVLDSTSAPKWRIYSAVWTRLYPIRRYLLFAYRHLFVRNGGGK